MPATAPAVLPIVLKDVVLLFGDADTGIDFGAHADQVTFTPSSSSVTWNGLKKNSFTDQSIATWAATINYAQDWTSPSSLSRFLYEHEGETIEVTFQPRTGVGPSFKVGVTITPGAIGGNVNAVATASVTLGCNGKPELIEPSTEGQG